MSLREGSTPGVPAWVADLGHLHALNEPALATDRAGRVVFGNTAAVHGPGDVHGWLDVCADSVASPEMDWVVESDELLEVAEEFVMI